MRVLVIGLDCVAPEIVLGDERLGNLRPLMAAGQFGVFILRGPRMNIRGQVEGMHRLDVAPTLLDVAGRDIQAGMQGRSLLRSS